MSYVKMLKNGEIPHKKPKKQPLSAYDRIAIEKRAGGVDKTADYAFSAPKNVDDLAILISEFKSGKAVLISLEKADAVNAERMLDFLGGAAFALDGRVESLGGYKYILVPRGVEFVFAGN